MQKRNPTAFDSIAALSIYFLSLGVPINLAPLVGTIAVFAYCALTNLSFSTTFKLSLIRPSDLARVIVVSLSLFWLIIVFVVIQDKVIKDLGLDFSNTQEMKEFEKKVSEILSFGTVLSIILLSIFPAVTEELLFRGVFLSGFVNNFGTFRAVIYSSIVFAIIHFIIPRITITFFLGIVFAVLVIYTRSIISSIIAHALNNLAVILLQRGDIEIKAISIDLVVLSLFVFAIAILSLRLSSMARNGDRLLYRKKKI